MIDIKNTEEINIITDVLVISGGLTGVKAASEIADSGYKVILIEKGANLASNKELAGTLFGLSTEDEKGLQDLVGKVAQSSQIDVLTQTSLISATGIPGDFTVRLSKGAEVIEHKVGAVVVATDFTVEPLNYNYELALSENVLTQSQLEELLTSDKKKLANKNVAFVVGFGQEGNPLVMQRVMHSVRAIEEIVGCTAYVYVNNIKVASDGLERLYKEGRDKGAIYFKLKEAPKISEDGKSISYHDPVVRQDIELSPDILVIEEALCADPINEKLAELLRIDLGAFGFIQKENVHRYPVCSNREGIFVVGSSRDIQNLPNTWADVGNAVLEVKDFLGDGKKIVAKEKAVVNTGKCTFCLTCFRCCPHGAIYWNEDNKAIISPLACQTCGICASECPMDAIQIGGFTDDDIKEEINKSVASSKEEPCILAFCCQNSAFEAGEMADEFKMKLPAGLQMIKVPCAGKIDLDYILTAFVKGADGVLVMTCHHGNCKSERGNTFAGWRVDEAQRMLEETGLEKDRLRFATLASNMGPEFSSIVVEMEEQIKELGLSPLKE